jgi:hypothetical protein
MPVSPANLADQARLRHSQCVIEEVAKRPAVPKWNSGPSFLLTCPALSAAEFQNEILGIDNGRTECCHRGDIAIVLFHRFR